MADSNATLTGTAFFDVNADGTQTDGERGVGSFPVDLLDETGKVVASQVTDAFGRYSFGQLAAGTYSLQFHASFGYRGNLGRKLPNGYDLIKDIRVGAGATVTLDEGYYQFNNDVRGFTFRDQNGNGVLDGGEAVVSGVKVQLLDTAGRLVDETVSSNADQGLPGVDGVYSFYNLKPGTYVARMVAPDGTVATGTNPQTFKIGAGQDIASFNFPFRDRATLVSLSGTAFADRNGNGTLDVGEAGLAGASVLLRDSAGYALRTTVADAAGRYSFDGLNAGTYQVTVATPQGLRGNGSTTVAAGTLAAGDAKAHLDVGFGIDPTLNKSEATPKSQTINIVLRGQSNSEFTTRFGFLPALKQQVEALLGFDGVNQTVNVLGTNNQPDGANTEWGGTALLKDWLRPVDGDYTKGWNASPLELGLLSAIGKLPEEQRRAPTAILYLHNEFDSFNADLTKEMWESGVRYEAGLVRGVLGQDASTTPYLFVNAIPFPSLGVAYQPVQNQTIRVGQTALTEDKSFNAAFAVNQIGDVTMNQDDPASAGGFHMNPTDAWQVITRAARAVAEQFKASALPGSPVAKASGDIDDEGPKVVRADAVAGRADQLLLTVEHDKADHMLPLSYAANRGVGWSIRSGYDSPASLATGIRAEVVDKTHVKVTFDAAVPAYGKLFYGWGGDRLAINQTQIADGVGNGNAIYDDNGMPAWVDPRGLGIAEAAAPTLKVTLQNGAAVTAVDLAALVSGDIAVGSGVVHGAQDAYNGTVFDVATAWNSVKTVTATSETAETLGLKDFVQADVTLTGATGNSRVTLENVKRGTVTTGGGNDAITVSLLNNDGGAAAVTVNAGAGNDVVRVYNGNSGNAGAGPGPWLTGASATNDGAGVQDGRSTTLTLDAGSGTDIIDLSHVSVLKALITGGTGADEMTASGGKDQFIVRSGDTGRTLADSDLIHGFDARGGDRLDVYGAVSDWRATAMHTAEFDGTLVSNTRDGAKIRLDGVDVTGLKGWLV